MLHVEISDFLLFLDAGLVLPSILAVGVENKFSKCARSSAMHVTSVAFTLIRVFEVLIPSMVCYLEQTSCQRSFD